MHTEVHVRTGGGEGEGKGVHTKIQGREWQGILAYYSTLPVLLLDEVTEWLSCMISGYRLQASSSQSSVTCFLIVGQSVGGLQEEPGGALMWEVGCKRHLAATVQDLAHIHVHTNR